MIPTAYMISGGWVAATNPYPPTLAKELLMPLMGPLPSENSDKRKEFLSFSLDTPTSRNWVNLLRPLLVDRAEAALR